MNGIKREIKIAYYEKIYSKTKWSDKNKRKAFFFLMKNKVRELHQGNPFVFLKYAFLLMIIASIDKQYDFDFFTYGWIALSIIEVFRFCYSFSLALKDI